MGRHKHLATPPGIFVKLLNELPHQCGIELILRLLDRQQRVWIWIVEQDKVGEHFDSAVRYIASDERILKTAILKTKYKAPILRGLHLYIAHAGDTLAHGPENFFELLWMILIEVLRDQRDVVAARGQMLGVADLSARPRVGDMKVGNMPLFNQTAKIRRNFELTKLA